MKRATPPALLPACCACNRSWQADNDDDDNDDDVDATAAVAADTFGSGRYPPDPRTCYSRHTQLTCGRCHNTNTHTHTDTRREALVNRKRQSHLFTCYLLTDRALRPACNLIEFYFCFSSGIWATPCPLLPCPAPLSPSHCLSHLGNFNIILSAAVPSSYALLFFFLFFCFFCSVPVFFASLLPFSAVNSK